MRENVFPSLLRILGIGLDLTLTFDWSLTIKLISSLSGPKLSENTILNVIWLPVLFHFIKIKKIQKKTLKSFI